MKSSLKNSGSRVFWTLASLKFAVLILLSLATVLGIGTVLESMHDSDYARHYVYSTWWFAALLCLLAANVFFSAMSRWPWKKHHTGFLITHLGILILLGGSLWTLLKGYEGQVIIAEGETLNRMSLKEPALFFLDPVAQRFEEIPADFRYSQPDAAHPYQVKVMDDITLRVDDFLPHAEPEIVVKPGEGLENPALRVRLSGSRATVEDWILAREFDRQRLSLGPASLNYIDVPDRAALQKILADTKTFSGPMLQIDGQLIPVMSNLNKPLQIADKKINLSAFLPHAAVTEQGLKNISANPANPAVQLSIVSPKGEEGHVAFAKFPELSTLTTEISWKPSQVRLFYLPPDLGKQNNEMVIARLPDGQQLYSLKAGGQWGAVQTLPAKASFPTGWMDFNFSLLEEIPKAEVDKTYRKVLMPAESEEGPPSAIHLSLSSGSQSKEYWMGRGDEIAVGFGEKRLKMAYGMKNKPLGFGIKLEDFRMGKYEGTNDPSSYESLVTVMDPQGMKSHEQLIAMNQPLKFDRYKVFQASYQLNPDGPDWSVLAVTYDPGIFLKYTGAIVMVSGIILMFFLKPLFVQKKIALSKKEAPTADAALPELGLKGSS